MTICITGVQNDARMILDLLVGKVAENIEAEHMDVDEYADGVVKLYSDTYVDDEFVLNDSAKKWGGLEYVDTNEYDAIDCNLALVSHPDCDYTAVVRHEKCRASNSCHTLNVYVVKSDDEAAMARLLDFYEGFVLRIHRERIEEAFDASNALLKLRRNERPAHDIAALNQSREKRLKAQRQAYVAVSHAEGCDGQPALLYARSLDEAEEMAARIHKQADDVGEVYVDTVIPLAALEMNNA